jgi:hypothetical protein
LFPDSRLEKQGPHGAPDIIVALDSDAYVVMELRNSKNTGRNDPEREMENKAHDALESIRDEKFGGNHRLLRKAVISVGVDVFDRAMARAFLGTSGTSSVRRHEGPSARTPLSDADISRRIDFFPETRLF